MTVGRHTRHPLWMRLAIVTAVCCGTMTVAGSCRSTAGSNSQAPSSELRVGIGQLPSTSPSDGLRQFSQNVAVEALVRPGEDGRLQPWLADSWTTAPDGRSLRIHLRSGVKFHDGSPFDAQAVSTLLPDALRAYMGSAVFAGVRIDVSGPQTIDIGFQQAAPFLMEALETPIRKPGGTVIGTGPFMVATDSKTELHANKNYYLGPPRIDRISLQTYPTVRAAWADMLRDRIDMLYDVGLDALDSLETATNVSVFAFTRKYQYFIALNTQSLALHSPRIRQALNMAVDRAAVVRAALSGHALVSRGPFWASHWALRADSPWFEYDPQRAANMLAAESRSTPRAAKVQFRLLVPPDAVYERIALEVKRQLEQVGIILIAEQVALDRLFRAIETRKYDAVLMEGVSGPTLFRPYQVWHSGGTFNPGGMGNATVDAAFDRLRAAASEDDFRTAAAGVQQAYMDDPPVIFLGWTQRARAVSKRFHVATDPGRPDVLGTMRLWKPIATEGQTTSRH